MTTQNSEPGGDAGNVSGVGPSGVIDYPVVFNVKPAEKLNRITTLFRIILAIPIVFILGVVGVYAASNATSGDGGDPTGASAMAFGLSGATALMILFRQK